MSEPLPSDKVLVARIASPSDGAYHTTRCQYVRDNHMLKSREWAERSRLEECSVCAGTAGDARGTTFDSLAHQLRREGGAHD